MNAQASTRTACDRLLRLFILAALAVALAGSQGGCCCFECVEHCVAPLHYVPPRSALTPRNPPCSYVDPMCYGFHATCWRSWPAECDGARDCLDWCQQDAFPIPAKGEIAPPVAPMPMPEQPRAPAPPAGQPKEEPAPEDTFDAQAQPAVEHAALAPVIRATDVPVSARLEATVSQSQYSSRRSFEPRTSVELP
jgi:hypothetical protein